MKNKILTAMLAISLILQCTLMLSACGDKTTVISYSIETTRDIEHEYIYTNNITDSVEQGKDYEITVTFTHGYIPTNFKLEINGETVDGSNGTATYVDGTPAVEPYDATKIINWSYTISNVQSDKKVKLITSNCVQGNVKLSIPEELDSTEKYYAYANFTTSYTNPEYITNLSAGASSSTMGNTNNFADVNNVASVKYGTGLFLLFDKDINVVNYKYYVDGVEYTGSLYALSYLGKKCLQGSRSVFYLANTYYNYEITSLEKDNVLYFMNDLDYNINQKFNNLFTIWTDTPHFNGFTTTIYTDSTNYTPASPVAVDVDGTQVKEYSPLGYGRGWSDYIRNHIYLVDGGNILDDETIINYNSDFNPETEAEYKNVVTNNLYLKYEVTIEGLTLNDFNFYLIPSLETPLSSKYDISAKIIARNTEGTVGYLKLTLEDVADLIQQLDENNDGTPDTTCGGAYVFAKLKSSTIASKNYTRVEVDKSVIDYVELPNAIETNLQSDVVFTEVYKYSKAYYIKDGSNLQVNVGNDPYDKETTRFQRATIYFYKDGEETAYDSTMINLPISPNSYSTKVDITDKIGSNKNVKIKVVYTKEYADTQTEYTVSFENLVLEQGEELYIADSPFATTWTKVVPEETTTTIKGGGQLYFYIASSEGNNKNLKLQYLSSSEPETYTSLYNISSGTWSDMLGQVKQIEGSEYNVKYLTMEPNYLETSQTIFVVMDES